jgi:lactate dehydrogenase-like 2-hydroxyacid dehydrogenase
MDVLEQTYTLHHYWELDREVFRREIAAKVRGVATTGTLGCKGELIDALPALEIISVYGIGVDAVDLARAKARGIPVTVTPDVLTDDVADLAVGLMIAVSRRVVQADRYVRSGQWASTRREMPIARKVSGKKVGILGLGRIGKALAKRLVAMDMQVSYVDVVANPSLPYRQLNDVVELARDNDFLVVTAAASSATRKIVNKDVLEALGPEGTLVNVARGSIVDEEALVRALQEGRLGAAALDVFADEPNVPEALFTMPNVVLTPHIASGTLETRLAMGDLVIRNLEAHFAGRPLLTPFPII